jgi:hypothetical protein
MAVTLYCLGTLSVSGIYVYINALHKGDSDDDDDNNNNNNVVTEKTVVHVLVTSPPRQNVPADSSNPAFLKLFSRGDHFY